MSDRRLLKAMLWCALGAVLCFLVMAESAYPAEVRAMVGAGSSTGMGERGAGFMGTVEAKAGALHLEALGSTLDKYTGAGWSATGAADLRVSNVIAGAVFRHRDGGAWSKDTVWARAGLRFGPATFLYEHALTGYNLERRVEFRLGHGWERLALETRVHATRHLQGTGIGVAVLVGVR